MVRRSTERDKIFAAKVKEIRGKVSRREVAEKLGMSPQQLEKYENSQDRISVGKLVDIAKALDVNFLEIIPEEFLGLDNVDGLALYFWKKLSYQNKKSVIGVMREMAK